VRARGEPLLPRYPAYYPAGGRGEQRGFGREAGIRQGNLRRFVYLTSLFYLTKPVVIFAAEPFYDKI
jgi:hypothetical protein